VSQPHCRVIVWEGLEILVFVPCWRGLGLVGCVGILREVVSRTSVGKWLYWVNIISTCECAVNILSMFVFIVRVRCSTPIWVALSLMEGISRQASISGRWTPSMGKFGRIPIACRMALLSMPYMVVNCRSLKTPRWMAWYFDFNKSC
jgi:hypothetical protein